MNPTPVRTLVVSCPNWPVLALGPRRDRAVAIIEGGRVIACSRAARAGGVAEGQRRKDAESRCDSLVCLSRDPGGELRAFEPVISCLEAFGVEVALRQPGWAGFATRGPTRRLGGEAALAAAVGEALTAAFAHSPPLAGALEAERLIPAAPGPLTGAGWRIGVGNGPFVATLAARQALIVPAEETAAFLAPHPVSVLARPELVGVLERLGIHTLGAFADLRRSDVLARFGRDGAWAHDLASGQVLPGPPARPARAEFAVEAVFEEPAERVEAALFVARSLAEQLCVALEQAGRSASVVAEVTTTEGEQLERRWSHDGAWRPALIVERLRWQLDAWLTRTAEGEEVESTLVRGIERLRLSADDVAPIRGQQAGLFGRSSAGDERVERLAARVQGTLGLDAVQQAFLVGGRGPVERVRLVAFGDPPPTQAAADLPWPGRLPAPNPTRVFTEPPVVVLVDAAGRPCRVDGRGQLLGEPAVLAGLPETPPPGEETVCAWAGPWPVDERWWDRATRRRRARLQVVTEAGSGYLLALEHGHWLLEGCYD